MGVDYYTCHVCEEARNEYDIDIVEEWGYTCKWCLEKYFETKITMDYMEDYEENGKSFVLFYAKLPNSAITPKCINMDYLRDEIETLGYNIEECLTTAEYPLENTIVPYAAGEYELCQGEALDAFEKYLRKNGEYESYVTYIPTQAYKTYMMKDIDERIDQLRSQKRKIEQISN